MYRIVRGGNRWWRLVVTLQTATGRQHRGFTLLEMVSTLFVIGVVSLLAFNMIAPAADESAAQPAHLALSRVVAAEQVFAAGHGRFTPDPEQLDGVGRDLDVVSGPSTGPDVVSIAVSSDDTLVVAVLASDGSCRISTTTALPTGGRSTAASVPLPCAAAAHLPAGEVARNPEPVGS